MPKLIDYPRTSYPGAWEVAEIVDDTGGKCTLETSARKLNRKVSGSFKAIVGSAVKFGLLTSKRETLTTTTLFRRIKHAYDKQEELLFHREAFLTPPLFTQLCRKFRSRELPVAMLDVLLIREFDVEEINAQNVAKAFVDGARMVGILDEHNIVADIDQLAAKQAPKRELASPPPTSNVFRQSSEQSLPAATSDKAEEAEKNDLKPEKNYEAPSVFVTTGRNGTNLPLPAPRTAPTAVSDAVANLFNLSATPAQAASVPHPTPQAATSKPSTVSRAATIIPSTLANNSDAPRSEPLLFQLQLTGPGINTSLEVSDVDDLLLVRALLDKLERQLTRS